jgi:succinate-acetate transporter protein
VLWQVWPALDGSWVDIGSAAFAIVFSRLRSLRPDATHGKIVADFLNGAILFTFLLMIATVMSSRVLTAIESSSHLTFFLSGGIGAFWIISELRKP